MNHEILKPAVYRVTWTQVGAGGRTVFVVSIIEGSEDGGVERHRATRFDRNEAERAAEQWAALNGYDITRRQAGQAMPQ